MTYIDIGANLTSNKFANLDDIIKYSFDNNIYSIIITGTNSSTSQQALDIVNKFESYNLFSTVGIHPRNAKSYNEKQYELLKKLLQNDKVVAIGECGLDYNRNTSSKEKQLLAFEKQIRLAVEFNKPLFLHERDATVDFIKTINEYKKVVRGVVHCYTGNKETVKTYLEMGLYIGLTGILCDETQNSELIEAVKCIPLEKIMVETDCPHFGPSGESINTPKNIKYVVEKIAEIKNIGKDELSKILLQNTKHFFGI